MSIPDKIEEILKTIKALENFMEKIKSERENSDLNAVAAKIIKEIKDDHAKCNCNKEILEALKNPKGLEIIQKEPESKSKNYDYVPKYSFPNYNVGNEELGSSKNPKALRWPFGIDQKPSES